MPCSIVLAAAALASLAGPIQDPALPDGAEPTPQEWAARAIGGWLSLPEDPHGRVFAAIGPETVPVPPPAAALAALAPGAAELPETWTLWSATLARVARPTGAQADGDPAGEGPDAASAAARVAARLAGDRTTLALLAAGQERSDDAWRWLAAHGPGAPEHVAGALAFLVPGVPPGTPIGAGGRPGPLAPGARLSPVAPPRPAGVPEWRVVWRQAEFRGLAVGSAVFDGKVVVEGSGSEVRITHRSGGAATLEARLASEPGFEFGGRYYDWEPLAADAPAAVAIELAPQGVSSGGEDGGEAAEADEEHVYWGRFVARDEQRPSLPPPGSVPAQLALGGVALVLEPGDPRRALVERIAAELTGLLGATVALAPAGADVRPPPTDFAPIAVRIPPGEAGARALAALASAVEAFLVPR